MPLPEVGRKFDFKIIFPQAFLHLEIQQTILRKGEHGHNATVKNIVPQRFANRLARLEDLDVLLPDTQINPLAGGNFFPDKHPETAGINAGSLGMISGNSGKKIAVIQIAGHSFGGRMFKNRLPIGALMDLSVQKHRKPFPHAVSLLQVVGNMNGRNADFPDNFFQLQPQPAPPAFIQRRKGLIQKNQVGFRGQGPGQSHFLFFSAGKIFDTALPDILNMKQFTQTVHNPVGPLRILATGRQPETDIFFHIQMGKQRIVLGHIAHMAVFRTFPGDILTVETDRPGLRPVKPQKAFHQGRLAAAGGAEQDMILSPVTGEMNLAEPKAPQRQAERIHL